MEAIKTDVIELEEHLLFDDEIDRFILDNEQEGPLPAIEGEERASRFVRAVGYWKREQARRKGILALEQERLKHWATAPERRMAWLAEQLSLFLKRTGATKASFPDGNLSYRKQPEAVEIEDEEAFCAANRGTPLVRVKLEPDRVAIKDWIKETGELPEGVRLVRADDKFTVTST